MCHMYTVDYYSALKKGKFVISNNMNEPGWHYTKWNKQAKKNTVWSHFNLKQTKSLKQRVEWGVGEMRRCWPEGTKFQLWGMLSSIDLMYSSMVTIVSNTLLHTWNLLRVVLKYSYYKEVKG